MPTYEHASSIGVWFFQALVESSKLRQMTFNEEAAHRNKPNARVQRESRWSGAADIQYLSADEPFVLILQGIHVIQDEATAPQSVVNCYIPYPQGSGLTPFTRRPVPVVEGFRGVHSAPPANLAAASFRAIDFDDVGDDAASGSGSQALSMPEANIGHTGIDAVTDYRTSLVITHRWSNNDGGTSEVNDGGYLFWRTIGHVAQY